jgi:CRP-like cAMP-binding protein
MAKANQARNPSKNCILSHLAPDQFKRLQSRLKLVDLELRQLIYEPNVPVRYAYFPEGGMISVVSLMREGDSIEVGTIGNEGMAGAFLLKGTDSVPYQFFVQLSGHAQRIEADVLRDEAENSRELRELILRYDSAFLIQTMQGVACNGLHTIPQRCCRWILMARDRAESDDLKLTHEFLALMLGVRQASITEVLQPLQESGLVRSHHGTISIINREGLEAGACECYRLIAEQQKRMLFC